MDLERLVKVENMVQTVDGGISLNTKEISNVFGRCQLTCLWM